MVEGKKNFKIVMIGESGTGKTYIVARYEKDTFTPVGKATTGGALTSKIEIVQLNGN